MSDSWDDYAENWDGDERVIFYSQKAYDTLCEVTNLSSLNVLDFGCGTGLLSEKIAQHAKQVVALDASPKMVEVLTQKKLPNVLTIAELLTETLISKNSLFKNKFDLIVASSVCGFLPDYEATIPLLKQLLLPDGVFVQWDWLSTDDGDDSGLTQKRVVAALKNTGFISVSFTQPFSISSTDGDMPVFMAVGKA
ncbi:MAG: methyltransferase domain-containing protein [Magnetococcales bacterium]|nr:methyltransferase domain-containing protein [Magnetococcales bacterium]